MVRIINQKKITQKKSMKTHPRNQSQLTAAEVTDDLEKSRSASLNFLFRLSALLLAVVFLKNSNHI